MRYYKVKVRHKIQPETEVWFYLTGDPNPKEELDIIVESCSKSASSYYPFPETLVEISQQDYHHLFTRNVFNY